MIKKIFSHAIPILMLILLFINPGFAAFQADAKSPDSPQQRTLYQDYHIQAGLTADDWDQIWTLMKEQNHQTALSPQDPDLAYQQAYLKASNTDENDWFGYSVAISGDTAVVGAFRESSNATGVNGNQNNDLAPGSGAAYVFVRSGTSWIQQAYLKASNTDDWDNFGNSVAVDGNTVVVGAPYEDSNSIGVDGDQNNDLAGAAGAAYIFVRNGTDWSQQAYLKASNTDAEDYFGFSVAVSGNTVIVGAPGEASNTTGVNKVQNNNSADNAGASYVFVRSGLGWSQQAYLKASNTDAEDQFGHSVAVSVDTVVVGAFQEDCQSTGVNGNQNNNLASNAGAAYVFVRSKMGWSQQAYLKASNTDAEDNFGESVSVSGNTVIVGAYNEDSNATGINGDQSNDWADDAGAAYVFFRSGAIWSQQAYLKASNTDAQDNFGWSVALAGDMAVVGARLEDSKAIGVNGNQNDDSLSNAGAAYVFVRYGTSWSQQAYLKASNTDAEDYFGWSVAVSGDTLVIGAYQEDSKATGVDGNQVDNSASSSGAAYAFRRPIGSLKCYLPVIINGGAP